MVADSRLSAGAGVVFAVIFGMGVHAAYGAAAPEPGERYALLIRHGRGFQNLLTGKYKFKPENIFLASNKTESVVGELNKIIGKKLKRNDLLLIVSCGHTEKGSLILKCSLKLVEQALKKIKAFKVVIQSTCYSGQALKALRSANIVYTSCKPDELCGGVFFRLILKALGDPKLSDKNKDGHISLGEAFDYANQKDLVQAGYAELNRKDPKFWPYPRGPMPQRRASKMQYRICLEKDWIIKKPSDDNTTDNTTSGMALKAAGAYAIVVSRETYADKNWRLVVDALQKKYHARVIRYLGDVWEARLELAALMPNYTCFVVRPEEAGRKFVLAVHRMTRQLDDDPYTDVVWGILTGYDATDALRIARRRKPLVVRRAASGTSSLNLDTFESGVKFAESQKGVMWVKSPGGETEQKSCPDDSTRSIVDVLNAGDIDFFVTSGHATSKDWQIGYSYKDGQFRCKDGQLFGLDTAGKRYDINSPNPKVYLASGNCLIGLISDRQCMALAWMHTGGMYQMSGYTVLTWFGSGWGVQRFFVGQPGRFALSEAFFFNNQFLMHDLKTRFPKSVRVNFQQYNLKDDQALLAKLAVKHRLGVFDKEKDTLRVDKDEIGLLWDRDTQAFYGDPAWEARLLPRELPWSQKFVVNGDTYTFLIRTTQSGVWPKQAIAAFLPHRVINVKVLEGGDFSPVITDNFILVPLKGKFQPGQTIKIVFRADRAATMARPDRTAIKDAQEVGKLVSQLPGPYQPAIALALNKAGKNYRQLVSAIRDVDKSRQKAMLFLIANMPQRDLQSLSRDFLIENVNLAYQARRQAPWDRNIPEQLFLNYILPYATLDERRDNWRKDFYDRFKSLAWKCNSPGEAARLLNREVFKTLKVEYHATKRPKPNQSPYESTDANYASCTGLSILLVDACRAVGIPARIVGIPRWKKRKDEKQENIASNHNWVEIWDGRWHHLGASEDTPLDKAWFTGRAGRTDPKDPQHRIYGSLFRKTGLFFPLVWDPSVTWVPAVDVTPFYTSRLKVQVKLRDKEQGVVTVRSGGEIIAIAAVAGGAGEVELSLAGGLSYDLEVRTAGGEVYRLKLSLPPKPSSPQ